MTAKIRRFRNLNGSGRESSTGRTGWRIRPPGLVAAILALTASLVLLCVRYNWWPLGTNMTNEHKFVLLVVSGFFLLVAGMIWLTRTALCLWTTRAWSWWITFAPVVVIAAVILAFVPGPSRFFDNRATFDRLAQQIEDNPGSSLGPVRIGNLDIRSALQRSDEAIYFYNADSTTRVAGWLYSPQNVPDYYSFFVLSDLGGGWYRFVGDATR
ncbi:hypothetical protein ACIGKQ_22410 [Gordonia sp. NPDC062954]|uniref:hypothetical protein n=1 Tax=Gordonia sp. NPDC062954 TaxID=3364003 RepID=UPI0037C873B9